MAAIGVLLLALWPLAASGQSTPPPLTTVPMAPTPPDDRNSLTLPYVIIGAVAIVGAIVVLTLCVVLDRGGRDVLNDQTFAHEDTGEVYSPANRRDSGVSGAPSSRPAWDESKPPSVEPKDGKSGGAARSPEEPAVVAKHQKPVGDGHLKQGHDADDMTVQSASHFSEDGDAADDVSI